MQRQGFAVLPELHGDGQRIAAAMQMIADNAIEGGQGMLTLDTLSASSQVRSQCSQSFIKTMAYRTGCSPDGLVD